MKIAAHPGMSGKKRPLVLVLVLCLAAMPVHALEPMQDVELASVSGQDGLQIQFDSTAITADSARWDVDSAEAVLPGSSAYLELGGVTVTGVGLDGAGPGAAFNVTTNMDVAANAGTPYVFLDTSWSRIRTRVDSISHKGAPGNSMGSMVWDLSGDLTLVGEAGLFNRNATNTQLRFITTDGQWYYRQNGNEFIWDNIAMDIGFDQGSLGIDNTGIEIKTPRFDWNILFDVGYRNSPGAAFQSTGVLPILRYGWEGGLTDFRLKVNSGGVWYGGDLNNRSEGLNISFRNNLASDFAWIIGDADDGNPLTNEAQVRFGAWTKLPGAPYAMEMPNITLDVINANQGPGGLTYDGNLYNVPSDAGALAVIIRNARFLAYNTEVLLIDPPNPDELFGWGLIYTLGDLDANLYLYPGGRSSSEGVRFDMLLSLQSPGNWNENSHFMIADTDSNIGIGFINTNFLVSIDNAYLELTSGAGGGLRLETDTDFRWRLNTEFGGGFLADLGNPIRGFDLDLDLHASSIDLRFQPPPLGETYIGFQWDVTFGTDGMGNPDSFIAIAEPSREDVRIVLGEIEGDIDARNGVIDLRSGTEYPDGQPRLAFEQDLRFGLTAGSNPVVINNIAIGDNRVGAMAIPGGIWRGEFALKKQTP